MVENVDAKNIILQKLIKYKKEIAELRDKQEVVACSYGDQDICGYFDNVIDSIDRVVQKITVVGPLKRFNIPFVKTVHGFGTVITHDMEGAKQLGSGDFVEEFDNKSDYELDYDNITEA